METLISFLIAAAVTFLFVRRYLKSLAWSRAAPAAAVRAVPCPRCVKPVPEGAQFCAACGAPLALWTVHLAATQTGGNGTSAQGKRRPVINTNICVGCGSCLHACPEAGALELVDGKSRLAHPERCTGQAKCADACSTGALTLSASGVIQTMKVPLVKGNFETNIPGIYIVGELGGMGLIKTAINEGRMVVDHLKQRFNGDQAPDGVFDVAIVGAGPAGLSASLAAHQYNMQYITLEQGEIASSIRQYPRQKFLMAEPVEMPLYGSLYIADSTKESLLAVWETIVANTGVRIQTGTRVETVAREDGIFRVETNRGAYQARAVVLATGKRGTPRRLGAPGEELPKVSYRLIEAETYMDADVLVVGGGDSSIEAAVALASGGKNRVALSYRGEDFKRARERNQHSLAAAEREGRLRVLRKSNVQQILPGEVLLESAGSNLSLANDFVFVLIGGESPDAFLRKIGVEIVEKCVGSPAAAN